MNPQQDLHHQHMDPKLNPQVEQLTLLGRKHNICSKIVRQPLLLCPNQLTPRIKLVELVVANSVQHKNKNKNLKNQSQKLYKLPQTTTYQVNNLQFNSFQLDMQLNLQLMFHLFRGLTILSNLEFLKRQRIIHHNYN